MEVDQQVWTVCAGTAVRIPAVGSSVYYFPQGHSEQSTSPPDFSALPGRHPYYRCRVSAIVLLANPDTDEVFAKILLDPRFPPPAPPAVPPRPQLPSSSTDPTSIVASFTKILTPSDANNGGGFSVPRFGADSVFPPLDFAADTPVQTISVRDVHGNVWQFRHIYRGTPRRHLLTTGWSKFVNSKKLVAGDSVVFIRNRTGEFFVGVRRAVRSRGRSLGVKLEEGVGAGEGFSRNVKGRVRPESVVEAVRLAEMNSPFGVVYYPRAGSPDFVVGAESVEAAARVCWNAGLRVKMQSETEDSSRMTWLQGTVTGLTFPDQDIWFGSPWRMLQVTWDEPEVLKNIKSVNPWQVELASTTPHIQTPFPAIKRLKTSPSFELPNDTECNGYFPGSKSIMMENVTPSVFKYNTFPVGMQGARHNSSCESNLPCKITHHDGSKMPLKLIDVSTELSIGSASQSGSPSPRSQSSRIQYSETEHGIAINNSSSKTRGFFKLFGQIIQTHEQVGYLASLSPTTNSVSEASS